MSPGSLLWPSAAGPVPCKGIDTLLSGGQLEKSRGAWNQWDPCVGVSPAVGTRGGTSEAAPDPLPVALRANPRPRLGTQGEPVPGPD